MTSLLTLEVARAAFGHELARDHHPQTVALLGLFEVVRGHEYRGAGVGQAVNHFPERAARQRVDAGGRLVEEEYAGLVHDGRAEGYALLPSSGQTACDLTFFPFESRKREYPALLIFALPVGHAVVAREETQVIFSREVVVERKLLRHIADLPAHGAGAQASFASEVYFSARRLEHPAEHLDGRRLARSVRAEQPVNLPVSDLQADPLHGG